MEITLLLCYKHTYEKNDIQPEPYAALFASIIEQTSGDEIDAARVNNERNTDHYIIARRLAGIGCTSGVVAHLLLVDRPFLEKKLN